MFLAAAMFLAAPGGAGSFHGGTVPISLVALPPGGGGSLPVWIWIPIVAVVIVAALILFLRRRR